MGTLFNVRSVFGVVQSNSFLTLWALELCGMETLSAVAGRLLPVIYVRGWQRHPALPRPMFPRGARSRCGGGLGVMRTGSFLGSLDLRELNGHTEILIYRDWTRTGESAFLVSPQERLCCEFFTTPTSSHRGLMRICLRRRECLILKWSLDLLLSSAIFIVFKYKASVLKPAFK